MPMNLTGSFMVWRTATTTPPLGGAVGLGQYGNIAGLFSFSVDDTDCIGRPGPGALIRMRRTKPSTAWSCYQAGGWRAVGRARLRKRTLLIEAQVDCQRALKTGSPALLR